MTFNTPKVYVHVRVVDGPFQGQHIYGAYRVKRILKFGRGGSFILAPRSALYLQLCRLMSVERRPDRISLRSLRNSLLRVSVRTVTVAHDKKATPECLYYSVVDELLCVEAGPGA